MVHLERRLFIRSMAIGLLVTAGVLGAGAVGLLDRLEYWLYDQRAVHCQIASPPPTTRIAHLDIDDASLEAIGRWPWPRATLARVLDEVERARPSAVGLDILFTERQKPELYQDPQGKLHTTDGDAELAKVLDRGGNVVLATSLKIEAPDVESPATALFKGWFADDLEFSREAFGQKLIESGIKKPDASSIDDLFTRARRSAMKDRLDRELRGGLLSEPALVTRILPHVGSAQVNLDSPLIHLLANEYAISSAEHGVYRFGGPDQTMSPPPVNGTFSALPVPIFSSVCAGCGFTNYDIFDDPTIRAIPLFAEYNHRLYPQMGLAMACVMLGANPTAVRFDGSRVIIPARQGTIVIPTFIYHSKARGRDVSLVTLIPWFGTRDWETMYDWPGHQLQAAHFSLARVWDICRSLDNIKKNNAIVDHAISFILDDDREDKLRLDPGMAKKYATTLPDPLDIDARQAMALKTLDVLKASGWLEQFQTTADKDLSQNERYQRDELFDARDVLNKVLPQNRELRQQVDAQRQWLAGEIGGKGVLVGFTATGVEDKVSTSLHSHCPGVVVHGVIANAVLTGNWWHVAPRWVTAMLTLIFGIGTAFIVGWFSPLRGALFTLVLLVGYALFNGLIVFGLRGWVVGLAAPMTAIVAVWAGVTLYRLVIESIERFRIATEVAVINREMDLARQVQVALIPAEPPKMEELQAEGWALPASVTGGDCYDLWELRDGRLAVLLADASGHGLAPAMVVSQVRTLVRALCDLEQHPLGLLRRVNSRVAEDLEPNRFITAFLGFLSRDGKLEWASAGHGPMFWCASHDGKMEMMELNSTGMPLGILADWFTDEDTPPVQLHPTGLLVVLSDGIFEAHAPNGDQFGTDRVKEILGKCCGMGSGEIIAKIKEAVQQWQGKVEPVDDQTIVVIRRIGQGAEVKANA